MPSQKNAEFRAVFLVTSLVGSPETPESCEWASTAQTLNRSWYSAYGSTADISFHLVRTSVWKSSCWAAV